MTKSETERGGENARAVPRSRTILSAVVLSAQESAAVTIRNLSVSGAMVELSAKLSPGDEILLRRGSLQVESVVRWCFDGRAGISFREIIVVQQWAAQQQGVGGQTQVDRAIAAARPGVGTVESASKRTKQDL